MPIMYRIFAVCILRNQHISFNVAGKVYSISKTERIKKWKQRCYNRFINLDGHNKTVVYAKEDSILKTVKNCIYERLAVKDSLRIIVVEFILHTYISLLQVPTAKNIKYTLEKAKSLYSSMAL